jgi:hypothetical protein
VAASCLRATAAGGPTRPVGWTDYPVVGGCVRVGMGALAAAITGGLSDA